MGRGGVSGALPGLQMGACSTVVVDVRMDFSRSRSLSDEDVAVGLVRWVGPPGDSGELLSRPLKCWGAVGR